MATTASYRGTVEVVSRNKPPWHGGSTCICWCKSLWTCALGLGLRRGTTELAPFHTSPTPSQSLPLALLLPHPTSPYIQPASAGLLDLLVRGGKAHLCGLPECWLWLLLGWWKLVENLFFQWGNPKGLPPKFSSCNGVQILYKLLY